MASRSPTAPGVSFVIRARDEEPSIGRCIDLVRAQDAATSVELIVVDSGSRDRTAAIARERQARVIEIAAESFTFGGALNTGCDAAQGELIVALSAHAFVEDPAWLGRVLRAFEDPRVACACGQLYRPDGRGRLDRPLLQDLPLHEQHPFWGYSNAAGAFRADLWRRHRFDERMPGSEDQAWARHWMREGYLVYVDPALWVNHDHSKDPLPSMYRRARREREGHEMFLDLPRMTVRDLVARWWTDRDGYRSTWRARLSHRRAARLLGAYAGNRRAHANKSR
jgi:rhamnosyltransferase